MNYERMLNRNVFRDKVYGCWTGKAAGGTLGAPYEWSKDMNNVTFYPPEIQGANVPNDDLDLQLVWLAAAERYGAHNVNERILAEYWSEFITGPWNEYGVCRNNIRMGLIPPLSGSCGNEVWKWSNGAWIRSEVWACMFPGSPARAAMAAYADACCDHYGEGIYAEMFTAAMESAAFVESDIFKLIDIALQFIPKDSRIASLVRSAIKYHAEGKTLAEARAGIMKDVEDLGYFQAPGNLAFGILGILYGQGDFGKTIAYAVNCGDDADCSGGFAGAVIGIILGKSGIPTEWTDPVGDAIITCSIDNPCRKCLKPVPRTLTELTNRVIACAEISALSVPFLMQFTDDEVPADVERDLFPRSHKFQFKNFMAVKRDYEMTFDQSWGTIAFEYENGPYIESGKPIRLKVRAKSLHAELLTINVRPRLPEGWTVDQDEIILTGFCDEDYATLTITPDQIKAPITPIEIEVKRNDRVLHSIVVLPMVKAGSIIPTRSTAAQMMQRFVEL